jgi:o-succinylbenzoate synthase
MLITDEIITPLDRIDLVMVKLPFIQPFATSVQTWAFKEALLIKMESADVTAWGECVADPDPYYSSETTGTARHIIIDFLLQLIEPGITLGELNKRFHHIRGHEMAKATLENALVDLLAKQKGQSLHEFLGQPEKKIMSGISIGLQETIKKLIETVEEAVEKKYHRIKMKIKKGQDIAWVAAIRQQFPDLAIMVDANGDYCLRDVEHLAKLDAFNLMMIEQPLSYSDIYQHSILAKQIKTPLCLDESIHSFDDAEAAIKLASCRILNIKQGRVGGLIESLRIAEYAAARGIDVWSGGMDETGIGRAVNIHLQTIHAFNLPGDTSETSRYFHEDIVTPPVMLDENGFISIPPGPGIGVQVIPEMLEKYTVYTECLFPGKGL